MDLIENLNSPGHIVFDHDGTLVNTDISPFILYEGIRELLDDLKSKGFILHIWTARPRRSVLKSTDDLGILIYFTDIFCSDDGPSKPNPFGLAKLTSGIGKNEILHIGDSLSDIEGAKAYGIEVVAACWNNPNQVNNYKEIANYTAIDLNQCRQIIKGKFYV